jgi:hypothetical protein
MSEDTMDEQDAPLWVWQGFERPLDAAIAGKALTDALPPEVAGVKVPMPGEPMRAWNKAGTRFLWAIQTRPDNPVPAPEGCEEADPALVGRMVGA